MQMRAGMLRGRQPASCCRPPCAVLGNGEQGPGPGLCAELFVPRPHRPRCSEDRAGWGRGPQFTPV